MIFLSLLVVVFGLQLCFPNVLSNSKNIRHGSVLAVQYLVKLIHWVAGNFFS